MKVKLAANAELDMLNKDELKAELGKHASLLSGGVRYRRLSGQSTGGPISFTFSPSVGYLWSLRAVSVQKPSPSTDVVQVWLNSLSPLSFVNTIPDDGKNGNFYAYTKGVATVQPGGSVIIQCPTTTGIGYASIAIEEVLVGEEWRL